MTPIQAVTIDQVVALGGFIVLVISLVTTLMWHVFHLFKDISSKLESLGIRLTIIEVSLQIENDHTREYIRRGSR